MIPNFDFENSLWNSGKKFIAGIDEVGRGAFAGPLVTASVIFPVHFSADFLSKVNDSKKVKPSERIKLSDLIKANSLWSIGITPVSYINRYGISKATFKAMRQALSNLPSCDHVLVDAFHIPHLKELSKSQTPIIKGDEKSFSIAAASILAKVYRDQLMQRLHKNFPDYGFDKNKGYGTKQHRESITTLGALKHHRTVFIRKLLS